MEPTVSAVTQAAQNRLRQTAQAGLRGVAIEFREGILVLRGRVPSFYCKQLAQAVVADLPEVVRVVNQLEVVPL